MVQAPRLVALLATGCLVVSCVQSVAAASPERIPLWKDGAPGSVERMHEEEKLDGTNVTNVHHPSITAYLPKEDEATGTAVIIAPGGGHRMLCLGHEGDSLAEWFADHGIAAFVLRYRLSNEPNSIYTLKGHAMDDTRRAIRTVRLNASEWKIDPDRIGILGFSAGGELAAYAAMEPDDGDASSSDPVEQQSSRPNFQGLIYPGKSGTFTVHKGMPPAFVAYGYHDRPDISIGMAEVYLKYKKAGVPCEMHVYANAGHGFGYRPGTNSAAGDWPQRFVEWLRDSKLLGT
ncbi:alpha/beta hydrolase [Rhodopirellula sp. MGV]|uniref:alpha/beta hydrolase n=1 Tax=Rhodopirellula sp. MGV TaxID=2023130 RepID=UPI000B9689DA|nr:alpha/beta hydrolase [Rhodopirellula sp. MGV]OYP29974.1 1,4-beta-xylanase [Rhodopirellula sp. MGV]PNY33430.1 alpha/beta hydrolase [Rhodopirellula baltica]